MRLCIAFLLAVIHVTQSDSDGKRWIWSSNRRSDSLSDSSDRVYTGVVGSPEYSAALVTPNKSLFKPSGNGGDFNSAQSSKVRYSIEEPSDFPIPPSGGRPSVFPEEQYRPVTTTINGRPDEISLVDNYRPNNRPNGVYSIDGFRPGNRPGANLPNNGYRPTNGGYRPQNNGPVGVGYRPQGNGPIGGGYRPQTSGLVGNGNRPQNGGPIGGGYRPQSNGPFGGGYRPTNGPNGRPVLTGPVSSFENDGRYKDYDRCKCVHSFNCNTPGIQFGTCDVGKKYCCYREGGGSRPFSPGPNGVRDRDGPRPVLAGPGGPSGGQNGGYRPYQDRDRYDNGPSGIPSSYDRYPNSFRDDRGSGIEEAYRKGLDSAIQEVYSKPNRGPNRRQYQGNSYQDYYSEGGSDFNRRPRPNSKYGLYDPNQFYGGRSINTTILSDADELKV